MCIYIVSISLYIYVYMYTHLYRVFPIKDGFVFENRFHPEEAVLKRLLDARRMFWGPLP